MKSATALVIERAFRPASSSDLFIGSRGGSSRELLRDKPVYALKAAVDRFVKNASVYGRRDDDYEMSYYDLMR